MIEVILKDTIKEITEKTDLNTNCICGIFLYGSQNYELATEHSDYDFICLVTEAKQNLQVLHLKYGQVKIYKLAYFISRLRIGDLECYEILFTKYRFVNNQYKAIFETFVKNFSEIMDYDRLKRALVLKLQEHLRFLYRVKRRKESGFYSKKRLYWLIRVKNQLTRLIAKEDFVSSLIYPAPLRSELIKIKYMDNYLSKNKLEEVVLETERFIADLPEFKNRQLTCELSCFNTFYNSIKSERCHIHDSI